MDCNPTIEREKLITRQSKWKVRFIEKSTLERFGFTGSRGSDMVQ